MAAQTWTPVDLTVRQNARFLRKFRILDDDGVAMSFAGYTPVGQVRRAEDGAAALILDLTPYLEVVSSGLGDAPVANDQVQLYVPATVTATLTSSQFKREGEFKVAAYDIFLEPADAADRVLLTQGTVYFDPAATRVED
jgi:hypothetical protein